MMTGRGTLLIAAGVAAAALILPLRACGQTTSTGQMASPAGHEVRSGWISGDDISSSLDKVRRAMDGMKAAGFNSVAINFNYSGFVIYPNSAYMAQYPACAGRPDVLLAIIQEARKRGLRAELLSGDGFVAFRQPLVPEAGSGRLITANPKLAQVDSKGSRRFSKSKKTWMAFCPANPASGELLAKLYVEAVTRYAADGLVLCNMEFASPDHCHCDYCRAKFREETGKDLAAFAEGSPEAKAWLEWKRKQVTGAVKLITDEVRRARPGIAVMVYASSPDPKKDTLGQSWPQWIKKGMVDAAVVRMAQKDISQPLTSLQAVKDIDMSRIVLGLSATATTADLIRNMDAAKACGVAGHLIYSSKDLGKDDLTALKDGPYTRPAISVFGPPIPESRDADTE